jgi:hypothetical protein
MENPEPRAQYLNIVLRQIDKTALRIPRFQRHFVWGESDVVDLLGSIRKGYPIGSILTWRIGSNDAYFSGYREDAFPTANEELNTFEVILDGAQRLSSLYGCLRNPTSDPAYDMYFGLEAQEFFHSSAIRLIDSSYVPMSTLFDSRRFLQVQRQVAELPNGDVLLPRVLDLYTTFQDYQIPIIALSNAKLEDVVEVFRRVNSSGTPLSSVDFVRALTWQSSFDLEETFDSLVEHYQGTPLEGLTEEYLIRCLAIASGLSLDTRDVLQLEKRSTKTGGLKAEINAIQTALDRLVGFLESIGITNVTEIPYEVQRLILFSIMHLDPSPDLAALEEWLWRSTFAEEHQSKPESYTSRIVKELRVGPTSTALVVRKPIDRELFLTRQRRAGSAVTIGFELLLRRSGARSLLSGAALAPGDGYTRLYSLEELHNDPDHEFSSASILANLILLTPEDASRWRDLRSFLTVEEVFRLIEGENADASKIWASQGIVMLSTYSPSSSLRTRADRLLGSVISEYAT